MIIMFAPVCEWNDFVGFNGSLYQLRKSFGKGMLADLVVVAPRKALSIITEADSFITLHPDADDPSKTFPSVLETDPKARQKIFSVNGEVRRGTLINFGSSQKLFTHPRNKSRLFDYAKRYIDEAPRYKDYQVRLYENEIDLYELEATKVYSSLFSNLQSMLRENIRIRPTEAVYKHVSKAYRHLTTPSGSANKTVMVITRHYINKAPGENTSILIPSMKNVIKALVDAGVTVLNVGFPAQQYTISGTGYRELSNEDLTQQELVALMYDCDIVIMSGRSGGFSAHVLSNVDIIMAHQEWSVSHESMNIEVFQTRKTCNPDIASLDMSTEFERGDAAAVVDRVINHTKLASNTFAEEKAVIYLK